MSKSSTTALWCWVRTRAKAWVAAAVGFGVSYAAAKGFDFPATDVAAVTAILTAFAVERVPNPSCN